MSPSRVLVRADGGSRGNPGPAAFGALLEDADTGEVLARAGERIGVASNNVAEYRGLIAGLELAAQHAPEALVEVRMDSKLVVEQMSGRWKIKHPDMRALAAQARELAPRGTTYAWIPRADNSAADALVNAALDGRTTEQPASDPERDASVPERDASRGWSPPSIATTLVLVRHGITDHTRDKRFSGGLRSANPGLNDEGRAQVRATGEWLQPLAESFDALVVSPVRRTQESAAVLAAQLGLEPRVEAAIAEMEFGTWDGLTFAEVQERFPDELARWMGATDVAPGGDGESFATVRDRVLEGRDRLLSDHEGQTVVVVSHVTPIKVLVADALGAPLDSLYRMELSPASVTVIGYYPPGRDEDRPMWTSLRLFNARPTDTPFIARDLP